MKPMVLVRHINDPAPVHDNVLTLGDERFWQHAEALRRVGGDVVRNLAWMDGLGNVIYPKTGVEIRQINAVLPLLETVEPLGVVLIMGAESSAALAETLVGITSRRLGHRE